MSYSNTTSQVSPHEVENTPERVARHRFSVIRDARLEISRFEPSAFNSNSTRQTPEVTTPQDPSVNSISTVESTVSYVPPIEGSPDLDVLALRSSVSANATNSSDVRQLFEDSALAELIKC